MNVSARFDQPEAPRARRPNHFAVGHAGPDPRVKLTASEQVSSPVFRNIASAAAEGIYYAANYVADMPAEENKYFVSVYRKG